MPVPSPKTNSQRGEGCDHRPQTDRISSCQEGLCTLHRHCPVRDPWSAGPLTASWLDLCLLLDCPSRTTAAHQAPKLRRSLTPVTHGSANISTRPGPCQPRGLEDRVPGRPRHSLPLLLPSTIRSWPGALIPMHKDSCGAFP